MKRKGGRGRSPSPKRTKAEQNVVDKVKAVVAALHKNDEFPVPGPYTNREMIATMVPLALGNGSASDERHPYQKLVVSAVAEILAAAISSGKGKVAECQSEVASADKEKTACQGALEAATGKLDAKKAEITEKQKTLTEAGSAVSDAEKALKAATEEVDNFDGITAAKEAEREKYNTALTVAFETLKKGEWENPKDKRKLEGKYTDTVEKLLEKCGADESLCYCIASALSRKPDERGPFDNKAVDAAGKKMTAHIAELDQRLGKGPALKTEKEQEAEKAKSTLESAQAKEKASEEALEAAGGEKHTLAEEVSTAKANLKKAASACSEKAKELASSQSTLAKAKDKMGAFKFLQDRLSTETSSFYWQIKGVKYDRELLNLCLKCANDGVIDLEEAKKIIECAKDGLGITAIEKQTIKYIMESGCTVNPDAQEFLDAELKSIKEVKEKPKADDDGKELPHDDDMGGLLEKVASQAEL